MLTPNKKMIKLVPITKENIVYDFLYSLHNNPKIIKYFHLNKSITKSENKIYWSRKLKNHNFCASTIIYNSQTVGMIRRDDKDISISILPEYWNMGIGSYAISKFYKKKDIAEIYVWNIGSVEAFKKAGFREKLVILEK